MSNIDVTDLHAVEITCPSCGSYIHRFLDRCIWCGWRRVPAYMDLTPGPQPTVEYLPRRAIDLVPWLVKHRVNEDRIRACIAEMDGLDERDPGAPDVVASLALAQIPNAAGERSTGPYLAAVGKMFADKTARMHLRTMLRKIGYRYLGGLSDALEPFDATLDYRDGALILARSSGHAAATVTAERIIGAHSQLHETGGGSSFGISFGHVLYFPDFSFLGGALSVVFVDDRGALHEFSVGNRDGGWSTKKGKPDFYVGVVQLLASWANMGAFARQAEIGLPAYARELGLSGS
jgi:hypothetical protein